MKELNWNSFTKKIHIKAPLENIYRCWATEKGITSWFLRSAHYKRNGNAIKNEEFIKTDDKFFWKWHNWDAQHEGEILEANGNDIIKFTFEKSSKVLVKLEKDNDAVLLSLNQYDIPTDDKSKLEIFYGCSNGWTFWLANLKAYLEYGILLNETEIDLRGYDLSGYEFVNM